MAGRESKTAIYAALGGNLMIAATKFVVASVTGSAAMLSEGIHSFVDTGNEVLLLYGMRQAARPPDLDHPFGHGRELYFWSFIVALLVFALGACVSFYEGIAHILAPAPIDNVMLTYAVLAIAALFEGTSWWVAFRQFTKDKGRLGYLAAIRESKDPTIFTVLFEDSAALAGLLIAFAGIFAAQRFQMPQLDGVASLGIGLILAVTAIFLARETKALLIGEQASASLEAAILRAADEDGAVQRANGVVTVHLAPDQVVAALSVEFEDAMTAPEIEACVERVEARLKSEHREITMLFVKPQTAGKWRGRQASLKAASDDLAAG